VENGYIVVERGFYKGKATKYWVCRKPDKKSPFVALSKVDNLSAKVDNLSSKAPQNVPINKVITNINNKEVFNNVSKEKDLKDGLKGLIKLKGAAYAKDFYVGRGYPEAEIKKVLEEVVNEDNDAAKSD